MRAFYLVTKVDNHLGTLNAISKNILKFQAAFKHNLFSVMSTNDRYLRRIDSKGHYYLRPDVTLLSPFYFGFGKDTDEYLAKSIVYLEKQLWDSELGMIQRYLLFSGDITIHTHAGNGPWLQYTGILAQYNFWSKNIEKGEELMNLINKYKNINGEIPEHISTIDRFNMFFKTEWKTGLDFDKEFDKSILIDNIDFDKILEESINMQQAYLEIIKKTTVSKDIIKDGAHIRFVTPLM